MTALEIRLIGYGLALLLLVGGSAYLGHHLTARHYEALIERDKAAQVQALADAQRQVIAAQQAQEQATQQAEKDHETQVQADTVTRNALLGRVRDLEAALHLGTVSGAVDHPAEPVTATSGPQSVADIAASVNRLNDAIAIATGACQHDSAELAAILTLAPH